MRARDGAVHASQSQLRFPLRYQMGHDLVPHPTDRPTAEAQIGMVPIAEFGRDRTPFRAIVDAPNDRFDRATVFSPRSCATNVGRRDRRLKFRPLRVRKNLHRLSTPTIKPISCAVVAASQEMRTDPSLRPNTSDISTFDQVFGQCEYQSPNLPPACQTIVDLGANIGL